MGEGAAGRLINRKGSRDSRQKRCISPRFSPRLTCEESNYNISSQSRDSFLEQPVYNLTFPLVLDICKFLSTAFLVHLGGQDSQGYSHIKIIGVVVRKFAKNPLRGTKFVFCRLGLNFFLPYKEVPIFLHDTFFFIFFCGSIP